MAPCDSAQNMKLNTMMQDDVYQMPQVDELVESLGEAKYIMIVDCNKGYYQLLVAVDDQKKTAFTTPFCKFKFTRIPFGL